ncbi:MAG: di/tricarboxylate transporter [Verrucomicrobiales bacterium]|jgi:di/tricarboxylate transporter
MMEFWQIYWDQIFVAALVVVVFIAFVKEWVGPDLVAMSAFVLVMLMGIVDVDTAMTQVFTNSAPIVIACMFILSASLERTGLIEAMGNWFEKIAGREERRILIVMMIVVAPLSAFINNTPVVVVFLPIVLGLARKYDLVASRFLIPLSYAAIVGGTCTIVGTSTNLIAAGIFEESLEQAAPFGMFEPAKLGLIFAVITFFYILIFSRKLLPDRVTLSTLFEAEAGKEFLTQALVSKDSPMVGKRVTDTKLAKLRELRVIEVSRKGERVRVPLNEIVLRAGDQLLIKSRIEGVMDVEDTEGIEIGQGLDSLRTDSAILMEGIVGPGSTLAGKSLKELNFRQRFSVIILAVHRRGVNLRERFEDVKLEFGDTILVEGAAERMKELFAEKDFVNLSKPKQRPLRRNKAPIAALALIAFLIVGSLKNGAGQELVPRVVLALAAVLIVLLCRCIGRTEAYAAVEWKLIFMIFGMLGLGYALGETGAAETFANWAVGMFGKFGAWAVLAVIYLLAALLTELISNSAVAALMTPIAISVALSLNVDPRPLVVAVMFGASASFSTPIGYQTNTYVYGAGGYQFTDFARIGIPLAVLLWIVASLLIPLIWPF